MPQPSSRLLVGRRCKHLIGKRISGNCPNGRYVRNESEESRLSMAQTFMASREISLSVPRNWKVWTLGNNRRPICMFLRQKMTVAWCACHTCAPRA